MSSLRIRGVFFGEKPNSIFREFLKKPWSLKVTSRYGFDVFPLNVRANNSYSRFQDEVVGPLFWDGATSNQDIFAKNYSPEKKCSSSPDVKMLKDSIFVL